MPTVAQLAIKIRNALHAAAGGNVEQWVALSDITPGLRIADEEVIQAAIRQAADHGWIATGGGRTVHSVRMTPEGVRLSGGGRPGRKS